MIKKAEEIYSFKTMSLDTVFMHYERNVRSQGEFVGEYEFFRNEIERLARLGKHIENLGLTLKNNC